jgi:hypothetical protein
MEYVPYLNDRLIAKHPAGFVVIVPADATTPVALSCPVCDAVMRSREDESSWFEFSCCYRCAMTWAHARRSEWSFGWRPSVLDVDLERANRSPMTVTLDID